MENIEYIYDAEIQSRINALKTKLANLKEIYLPLINTPTIGAVGQASLISEYLDITTNISTCIVEIINTHKPIALIVKGESFKIQTNKIT